MFLPTNRHLSIISREKLLFSNHFYCFSAAGPDMTPTVRNSRHIIYNSSIAPWYGPAAEKTISRFELLHPKKIASGKTFSMPCTLVVI